MAISPLRLLLLASLLTAVPVALNGGTGWSGSLVAAVAQDDDDGDDDDDDGGDDDDDDGSDDGESGDDDDDGPAPPQPRVQPRSVPASPPPPPPLLSQAPDQIVVLGLTEADVELLENEGFTALREDRGVQLFGLPEGQSVDAALQQVALLTPGATGAPNTYYRNQAGEACAADICAAWAQVGWDNSGERSCLFRPVIGVIDTGINLSHDMLEGADISLTGHADPDVDASGVRHGTAVVTMLVGRQDGRVPGLVPDAKVVVADPFVTGEGGDERADAFSLYSALRAMIDANVHVVNLSLAGPDNPLIAEVVRAAVAADVAIVAAVGNAGPQSAPLYPAAYPDVIGVTAVDSDGNIYRRAVQGAHVDMAAPGVEIATAASISGIRPQTGTSFAAPFVTVAVASARAAEPELSVGEIMDQVMASGLDLGANGHDPVFGHGMVQIGSPC